MWAWTLWTPSNGRYNGSCSLTKLALMPYCPCRLNAQLMTNIELPARVTESPACIACQGCIAQSMHICECLCNSCCCEQANMIPCSVSECYCLAIPMHDSMLLLLGWTAVHLHVALLQCCCVVFYSCTFLQWNHACCADRCIRYCINCKGMTKGCTECQACKLCMLVVLSCHVSAGWALLCYL